MARKVAGIGAASVTVTLATSAAGTAATVVAMMTGAKASEEVGGGWREMRSLR